MPTPAARSTTVVPSTPSSVRRRRAPSTPTCTSSAPTRTPTTTASRSHWSSALTHHVSAKGYYSWSKTLQSNTLDGTGDINGVFVDVNYPATRVPSAFRPGSSPHDDDVLCLEAGLLRRLQPHRQNSIQRLVRISGIWTANSGQPFTVTTGSDNYFSGWQPTVPASYPARRLTRSPMAFACCGDEAVVRYVGLLPSRVRCRLPRPGSRWVCSETLAPAQLVVPGYRNVDASLFRNFDIHESVQFQLRGEVPTSSTS